MIFLVFPVKARCSIYGHNLIMLSEIEPTINQLSYHEFLLRFTFSRSLSIKNVKYILLSLNRYSTGWKCGLHPDWTELTGCVDNYMSETETPVPNRRYFYITFLRDPVDRYLSEWRHVSRGATWRDATLSCGGHVWGDILPKCYGEGEDDDWRGVKLKEFMECPHNLASDRQTRMLADLNLVNCYNTTNMNETKRNQIILNSAKANLVNMAYFGLTEEQEKSQYLFEETFNLRFKTDFNQLDKIETHSGLSQNKLSNEEITSVRNLNKLDVELYKFAKELLIRRFNEMKDNDDSFQEHLDEVEHEKEFSWEDIENENYDENDNKQLQHLERR